MYISSVEASLTEAPWFHHCRFTSRKTLLQDTHVKQTEDDFLAKDIEKYRELFTTANIKCLYRNLEKQYLRNEPKY
jgi:hypothetical protein